MVHCRHISLYASCSYGKLALPASAEVGRLLGEASRGDQFSDKGQNAMLSEGLHMSVEDVIINAAITTSVEELLY